MGCRVHQKCLAHGAQGLPCRKHLERRHRMSRMRRTAPNRRRFQAAARSERAAPDVCRARQVEEPHDHTRPTPQHAAQGEASSGEREAPVTTKSGEQAAAEEDSRYVDQGVEDAEEVEV
mmetsp:Transcript_110481/g.195535  ORF Transcript_110481/g.195535 Transcript_110481/m.195535 type:complete len:119 (+) Transcript_110481:1062-1418(+)